MKIFFGMLCNKHEKNICALKMYDRIFRLFILMGCSWMGLVKIVTCIVNVFYVKDLIHCAPASVFTEPPCESDDEYSSGKTTH